jgi:hypothetical protein
MYNVYGIRELIEYHLVASAPDVERAEKNLCHLVWEIQRLATGPVWRGALLPCDRCGASVGIELIHPSSHRFSVEWRLLLRRLLGAGRRRLTRSRQTRNASLGYLRRY